MSEKLSDTAYYAWRDAVPDHRRGHPIASYAFAAGWEAANSRLGMLQIDPSWPDSASVVVQGKIGGAPTGLTVGELRRAARAEARPATAVDREAVATLVDRLWQDLCEKDDRNSPAEYPDMLLISHDELSACVDAILALLSPATSPGEEGSSGAESARTGTLPVLTEGQHSAGGGKIPGVEEVIRYLRNYGPGTPDTTDLYFMRWAADHLCNLVSREAFWRSQAQTSEAG